MIEFHKVWIEQSEAARHVREAFGLEKAIGYLVGEKLLNFLEASYDDADFAGELPPFVEGVKRICARSEMEAYLDGVRRGGALGHVASDEAYEDMQEAGAVVEDPVEWAKQILLVERMKKLLLA